LLFGDDLSFKLFKRFCFTVENQQTIQTITVENNNFDSEPTFNSYKILIQNGMFNNYKIRL